MIDALADRHVDTTNGRGESLLCSGGIAGCNGLTYALYVGANGGSDVSVSQGPLGGLSDSLFRRSVISHELLHCW